VKVVALLPVLLLIPAAYWGGKKFIDREWVQRAWRGLACFFAWVFSIGYVGLSVFILGRFFLRPVVPIVLFLITLYFSCKYSRPDNSASEGDRGAFFDIVLRTTKMTSVCGVSIAIAIFVFMLWVRYGQ